MTYICICFLSIPAVAASELRANGGTNPAAHPWIPVVAYLETLPRPTKPPSRLCFFSVAFLSVSFVPFKYRLLMDCNELPMSFMYS